MNDSHPASQQHEDIVLSFDRQRHAGGAADIDQFLPRTAAGQRQLTDSTANLLLELIKVDLEYVWKEGERRTVEFYLEKYPALNDRGNHRLELACEELLNRVRCGDDIPDAELADRFGDQADRLRTVRDQLLAATDGQPPATDSASQNSKTIAGAAREIGASIAFQSEVVGDRYELKRLIGQGSFADVFLAWDRSLLRNVAIKVSRFPFDPESEAGGRFFREAIAAAKLAHPGIVAIYEVGQHQFPTTSGCGARSHRAFIAQELLLGGAFEDQLKSGRIHPERAVRLLIQILEAVGYAHQCGIIHRDLKPANILIDQHGFPRVADFGLATFDELASRVTREGDLLGTPAYMSPEQARGDVTHITPASDIYSLGVILYQLLTDQLPFTGSTSSVLHQIVSARPKPPRSLNPQLSRDLQTICLKAMAKEPSQRYASCRAFAEDLSRYCRHEPILARPPGPAGRLILWAKRKPTEAITVAVSLMLLTAIAVFSIVRIANERNRFREQRDLSNQSLYSALVKNVESQLRIKETGWWNNAITSIEQAIALDSASAGHNYLRDLACEMLLDSTIRLEPVGEFPAIDPRPAVGAATSAPTGDANAVAAMIFIPEIDVYLVSYDDGQLIAWDRDSVSRRFRLAGHSRRVHQLAYSAADQAVWGQVDSQLWRWDLTPIFRDESPTGVAPGQAIRDDVTALAVSGSGQQLAIGTSTGEVWISELIGLPELVWLPLHSPIPGGRRDEIAPAHIGEVCSIAFDSKQNRLATSGLGRQLILWDLADRSVIQTWGMDDPARNLIFSGDPPQLHCTTRESYSIHLIRDDSRPLAFGTMTGPILQLQNLGADMLLCGTHDGRLSLWKKNRQTVESKGLNEVRSMAIEPGGTRFATGHSDGRVLLWQAAASRLLHIRSTAHAMDLRPDDTVVQSFSAERFNSGRQEWIPMVKFQQNTASAMAAGAHQNLAAIANDRGQVVVYRQDAAEDSSKLQTIDLTSDETVVALAFGDRDQLLAVLDAAGRLVVLDVKQGSELYAVELQTRSSLATASIEYESASGFWYVAAERRLLGIDPITRQVATNRSIETRNPHGVLAIHDGLIAFASSADTVEIRAADTWEFRERIPHSATVKFVDFTPDGKSVVTIAGENQMQRWDLDSATVGAVVQLEIPSDQMVVDPLGRWIIASGGGFGQVIRVEDLTAVLHLRFFGHYFRFSRDGQWIWHSRSGMAEMSRHQLTPLLPESKDTFRSPNIVDVEFKQVIPGGHLAITWSVDCSHDGRLTATGSHDQMVKLWDNSDGRLLHTWSQQEAAVWRVAFSTDAAYLAAGTETNSPEQGLIIIWDVATRTEYARYPFSTRLIGGLDWHPHQPWLAVGSYDGTVKILDWRNGETVFDLGQMDRAVLDVHFSPDGKQLAAACTADGLAVWRLPAAIDTPVASPQTVRDQGKQVWAVCFSRDGSQIATGDQQGIAVVYDSDTLAERMKLPTGCLRLRYLRFGAKDRTLHGSGFAGTGFSLRLAELEQQLRKLNLPVGAD